MSRSPGEGDVRLIVTRPAGSSRLYVSNILSHMEDGTSPAGRKSSVVAITDSEADLTRLSSWWTAGVTDDGVDVRVPRRASSNELLDVRYTDLERLAPLAWANDTLVESGIRLALMRAMSSAVRD